MFIYFYIFIFIMFLSLFSSHLITFLSCLVTFSNLLLSLSGDIFPLNTSICLYGFLLRIQLPFIYITFFVLFRQVEIPFYYFELRMTHATLEINLIWSDTVHFVIGKYFFRGEIIFRI